MKLSVPAVLLCATLVSGSASAQAMATDTLRDTSVHTRQTDLSLMAWLPWYYGFGIGAQARFEIPVLPDGIIPNLNDEITIEPSIGLAFTSWYFGSFTDITPAVYGVWGFHLTDQVRVYGGLGLGLQIGIYTSGGFGGVSGNRTDFYWDPVVGLNYKIGGNFALRGELGAQGLKAGISIYF